MRVDGTDDSSANPEVVTWRDVKSAGFCLHIGARRWCGQHGVSFRQLMTTGLPIADLLQIDDDYARRVIWVARKNKP